MFVKVQPEARRTTLRWALMGMDVVNSYINAVQWIQIQACTDRVSNEMELAAKLANIANTNNCEMWIKIHGGNRTFYINIYL